MLLLIFSFSLTFAQSDVLELHLWHQRPAPSRAILDELLEEYHAQNPHIKVSVLYKENEELRMGYMASAAFTGGGPELLYGPSDFTGSLVEMGIVRPLDDVFSKEEMADFDPNSLINYQDSLYQIGDELGNHLALVWNKRLFKEAGLDHAPQTMSELIEYGQILTKDFDNDGIMDQYGLVWNYTEPFFVIPFYTSFGGEIMDAHQRPTLDNDAAISAYQLIVDMRDSYKIIPGECDYDIADSKFNSGKAGMLINGSWAWKKYMESPDVDFGLSILPINDATGLYPKPMTSGKGYFINPAAKGRVLEETKKLLRFLVSYDAQLRYSKELATISTRYSVRNNPEILADPIIATSIHQVEHGIAMPITPEMRAIWDALRPAYQNVLGGSMTPEEGAAYQQKLAVEKIAELYEGDAYGDETPISVYFVYFGGILLAFWAMYKLFTGFILPLLKNSHLQGTKDARFAVWLVAPAAIIMFGVVVYPFFYNLLISLSNMGLTTIKTWKIIGFSQYGKVFTDPNFYTYFIKTILWTGINVAFHVSIGVFLAILLNRPLPGKGIIRVLLVLPWAVPSYITALTWRGMFNSDYGAINVILKTLFSIEPTAWLTDPFNAFAAAIITNIWLGIPFMMIIALGGLQSIPKELYEAASIDGASAWQQFKKITLPLLRPVMIPAITLGIVWTFNNINIVWLVSNGGQPGDQTHILVSFVYQAAFNLYRYGYAAAFSFVIFMMLVLFSVYFMKKQKITEGA